MDNKFDVEDFITDLPEEGLVLICGRPYSGKSTCIIETLNRVCEKESAILKAEAQKEAQIKMAEGEAEALLKIKKAEADGIKLLREAKADTSVLTLKSYEALEKLAEGQSTKIIVPSDMQNIATFGTVINEMIDKKK